MEIQRTNNLQFGARFISPAKIKYKAPNGKWEKMDVSFIKFDTYKKSDVSLVENISQLWNNKNLSGAIAEEANILGRKSQIYALTSQLKDFEQINPRQVLGLMTTGKIKKGEDVEIFKIGTNNYKSIDEFKGKMNLISDPTLTRDLNDLEYVYNASKKTYLN